MDAVTDPTVSQVTVMKSARVGYTKILDHVVGYFLHQDPSPILVVQPRVEDAEDYSRTEIAPMFRDTPVLAEIAGELKSRNSSQRIVKRVMNNGASVSFVGANSPGGFRRITARIIAFDEVDGYPSQGAGDDGDQITLGTKRGESFWNRKVILGSTPLLKGVSRIEKSWDESDQRRYFVPCPHCGHRQTIKWSNLQWEKDDEGNALPETAHLTCEGEAACRIEEHHKPWMIDHGRWVAEKPFKGHAGFHIWAGYSLFPNAAWPELVKEWLRVHKDPTLLRTFVNLVLGETWEEGEAVGSSTLIARAEAYGPDDLPDAVKVVTGFCDVQGDRLEVQAIGWGADEEAWPFLYEVIHQDPAQPTAWQELDSLLRRTFRTVSGRVLRFSAFGIDFGGNHGAQVLQFVRARKGRRVFATFGGSGKLPIWPLRASLTKQNEKIWRIGVDTAKDAVSARLGIKQPGPGYVHFPAEENFGPDYFEQLTSERKITRFRMGRPVSVWYLPSGKRNEAFDTFVGALAVRRSLPRRIEIGLEYSPQAPLPDTPADDHAPLVKPVPRTFSPRPLAVAQDPYL